MLLYISFYVVVFLLYLAQYAIQRAFMQRNQFFIDSPKSNLEIYKRFFNYQLLMFTFMIILFLVFFTLKDYFKLPVGQGIGGLFVLKIVFSFAYISVCFIYFRRLIIKL